MTHEPKKPDFSNAQGGSATSTPKADFGNVNSGSASTAPTAWTGAEKTYTVVHGDSLSKIAKHVYGDSHRWREIFDANRDQLDNPDLIQPGQVLKLPADTKSNH